MFLRNKISSIEICFSIRSTEMEKRSKKKLIQDMCMIHTSQAAVQFISEIYLLHTSRSHANIQFIDFIDVSYSMIASCLIKHWREPHTTVSVWQLTMERDLKTHMVLNAMIFFYKKNIHKELLFFHSILGDRIRSNQINQI